MGQILLTQEEEAIAFKDIRYRDNLEFITMLQASECSVKAQLQKVVEWMDRHYHHSDLITDATFIKIEYAEYEALRKEVE